MPELHRVHRTVEVFTPRSVSASSRYGRLQRDALHLTRCSPRGVSNRNPAVQAVLAVDGGSGGNRVAPPRTCDPGRLRVHVDKLPFFLRRSGHRRSCGWGSSFLQIHRRAGHQQLSGGRVTHGTPSPCRPPAWANKPVGPRQKYSLFHLFVSHMLPPVITIFFTYFYSISWHPLFEAISSAVVQKRQLIQIFRHSYKFC